MISRTRFTPSHLATAWHTAARLGLRRSCHLMGYRLAKKLTGWDVTHLLVLDWESLRSIPAAGNDVRLGQLTVADANRWSQDPQYPLDRSLSRRIAGGNHQCVAAWQGEVLAGYVCLARGRVDAEDNRASSIRSGVAIDVGQDSVFLYNAFVHPSFRGRRLYGTLIGASMRWQSEQGVRRIVSTADWTNFAALRSCLSIGFRAIGRIHRIYGPCWDWTITPSAADAWGIHFPAAGHVRRRRQASSSGTTWPWTSVSRKSLP